MHEIDRRLIERADAGRPIAVAIVGAGQMGARNRLPDRRDERAWRSSSWSTSRFDRAAAGIRRAPRSGRRSSAPTIRPRPARAVAGGKRVAATDYRVATRLAGDRGRGRRYRPGRDGRGRFARRLRPQEARGDDERRVRRDHRADPAPHGPERRRGLQLGRRRRAGGHPRAVPLRQRARLRDRGRGQGQEQPAPTTTPPRTPSARRPRPAR